MAKFGVFVGSVQSPLQEFEGDYMLLSGEFVKIYRNARNSSEVDREVGVIRLDKGQCVREL